MPLAAEHQLAAGQRGLEVLLHAAGDVDGRAGDVRPSQRPRPCRRAGRPDTGKKQAETAGFLACQGMLHKYLEAARDDQFLLEQDLHEPAAPMGGRLPNSEHRISELPVTTDHRVAIFMPEPVFRSPLTWGTATSRRRAPEAQIWAAPPASTQDRSPVQDDGYRASWVSALWLQGRI